MKLQTSSFAGGLRARDTKQKNKNGPKRAWLRSRDLLFNFGTSLLSLVRMKLQTSNFAGALRVRETKQIIK